MKVHLVQDAKLVHVLANATDAAGRTSALYPSFKNYSRAFIVFTVTQGNAATILLTPLQATAVAGTGSKVLTNAVPIWVNSDVTATDTLVRQADAVNYTTSAALATKMVVFQIDPEYMDVAGGFDCIGISTGASNAANLTAVTIQMTGARFGGTTPATAIVD